jgi:IS30 family transposase
MKSYTHFTLNERICIEENLKIGKSIRSIAKTLGRSPSSVSREIKRNFSKKKQRYNHFRADILYKQRRKRCKRHYKIVVGSELYNYIYEHLLQNWSPEMISIRAKKDGFFIALSTIYKAIKNKLFKGLTPQNCLRRRGKKRHSSRKKYISIKPEHTIHDRPEEANNRSRLGDWEGDTVYGGIGMGCLVTLVDRKSRYLIAKISQDRSKESIKAAFIEAYKYLSVNIPIESITLDNGSEFAAFKEIEKSLNTTIYFADVRSPWQRGTNENTNGILRFYYPKGTNFKNVTDDELQKVVNLINNRPRKCLDALSPIEYLKSVALDLTI